MNSVQRVPKVGVVAVEDERLIEERAKDEVVQVPREQVS